MRKKRLVAKNPMEEVLMGLTKELMSGPIPPAGRVVMGAAALFGIYAVQKYAPGFKSVLRSLLTQMTAQTNLEIAHLELEAASAAVRHHPEGAQSTSAIDERQLGRSEVINEIARGKPN